MSVTALVPAHQEEDSILETITALQSQTAPVERIVVIADNCTDRTVEIALAAGAEVFETSGNTKRKAGALNQALAALDLGEFVLICDADTQLAPQFAEVALQRLADPEVGAVGAVFRGEPAGAGLLGMFQAMEWTRYARQLRRTGRVWVLSGTGAVIRTAAARKVAQARGGVLPGVRGDVYLADALTEDFEFTIALNTVGYRMCSPATCTSVTELMPSWRLLWGQRLRWYGGALETIREHGFNKVTRRYWGQQVMLAVGVVFMLLYLGLTAVGVASGTVSTTWFWTGIGVLFCIERTVTVWPSGWKPRLLAAALIPELFYAIFLQAVFVTALATSVTGRRIRWVHTTASAT